VRVLSAVSLVLSASLTAGAQVPGSRLDSAGIAAAIATHLLVEPRVDSGWSVVIDTSGNRWNALVRRALLTRAASRLPVLDDSVSYYIPHFTVTAVAVLADTIEVSFRTELCYDRDAFAFSERRWTFRQTPSGWGTVVRGLNPIITGHGVCLPYHRKGAR